MEEQLSLEFLRVVENGAIAAARTMGFGDRHKADEVAVEAMRKTMDAVEMDGTIVIGEGERDEAPMLYIGEKVGLATHAPKALFPEVDIAVDPLEGTNLCATGAAGAIAVLAASEKGGLLHAPDIYMEKIVVGPSCKGAVELDAPVADNLKSIAKRLDRDVEDLVIIVLDRPRHEKLIGYPQGGRAHPFDRRRRLVRGNFRRGGGHQHSRGDGHRRRSRRRADRGSAALLERPDSRAIGAHEAARQRAAGQDGREGSQTHLRHGRFGAGKENDFRLLWRHGRKFAQRRALLRRRGAHDVHDFDAGRSPSTLH